MPSTFTQNITDTLSLAESVSSAFPYTYVTDSVRRSASILLRLLRRPVRYVEVDLPPSYGNVQPGDTIWCDHELLPEIDQTTNGLWRYVPLYVIETSDPIGTAKITIKSLDLREYYCSAWSPLRTDVGMGPDLPGIAMIDRAGGWITTRDQLAYGERPGGATELDQTQLFQEVLANSPVVSRFGLQVEGGGDTNHILNSTFSEGSGDTFTNWTKTTSGSAVGVSWTLYTLIDAMGFRRSIQLATFNVGENAYVSQTVAGMGGKRLFVRIHYRDGGMIDNTIWRVQRSSDSKWFRDSDSSWQVATTDNTLTHSGASFGQFFASNMLDLSGVGATSITVYVGIFNATPAVEQISQLNSVELQESQLADASTFMRYRSPLPTKSAAVTRVKNQTYFVNDTAVAITTPLRGFIKISIRPGWAHEDLLDGAVKYVWARDTLQSALYYQRLSSDRAVWRFENASANRAEVDTDLTTNLLRVTRGEEYTIICRWTSETQDEFDLGGQAMDIWARRDSLGTWYQGNTYAHATVDGILASSKFYLGRSTDGDTNGDFYADGHIFNFTAGDHCPTEKELKRM